MQIVMDDEAGEIIFKGNLPRDCEKLSRRSGPKRKK